MSRFILKHKWYVVVIMGLLIIEPSITSWLVFFLQKMYNSVTVGTTKIEIFRMITIALIVWTLKRLMVFAIGVIKSRFICDIKQDVKHDLFQGILNLNTADISNIAASGEYISVFTNDISIIEQRFFSNLIGLLNQVFSLLILGGSFLALDRSMAGMVLSFGVIVMFVPPIFSKHLGAKNLTYSNSLSKFTQKIKEFVAAYSTIKNYAVEGVIIEKFDDRNVDTENAKFEADYALSLADSVGSLLAWFMRVVVLGAGLVRIARGEMLLGTVMAAVSFTEEMAYPLQNIVENINSIRSVKGIAQKINNLCKSSEESVERPSVAQYQMPQGMESLDIRFEGVQINADGKTIIDNFTFTFEQGKKYLVIGKNGSGKSTLFKALKKRFRDCRGNISVGGRRLSELSNEELSQLVSYMSENVAIFSGTVLENISLFRNYSESEFIRAMAEAQINLDVSRVVGEDGTNISSGEQRRIEIARSLLKSAKIMVFDEVVSTLDIETAYEIERMALEFDQTVIFVSHNFSGKLIHRYDKILVMDNGKLVACGSYDQLIKSSAYFRRICEIKFG